MKNIKILTFHNAENYGATLQAYALKEKLKMLKTNPSFINYKNKDILKDYKLFRTNSLKAIFSSIWFLSKNLKRKNNFKKFIVKYLDGDTKAYYTKESIESDIREKDVYIAGSDQIFNPNLTNGLSDIYTLNFNKEIKSIIYGASVGNEEVLNKYYEDYTNKLKHIDMLSVREDSIAKSLEKITNKKVEKVLDPTLLLDRKAWDKLLLENNPIKLNDKKYILVYTLFENSEITKIANFLSEKTGLKIVHFRKYNVYDNEMISLYNKGPIDFINAFKNARYVVTNSFHGLVFSIIFEKNFYTVMPNERASRLKDLIDLVGLQERTIETADEMFDINIYNNIDYTKITPILDCEKEKSINYLKKGINLK